jgi:hypothetical protein
MTADEYLAIGAELLRGESLDPYRPLFVERTVN